MIRRFLFVAFVALFAFSEVAPLLFVGEAYAQDQPAPKKRKTLFDMLFGGDDAQSVQTIEDRSREGGR